MVGKFASRKKTVTCASHAPTHPRPPVGGRFWQDGKRCIVVLGKRRGWNILGWLQNCKSHSLLMLSIKFICTLHLQRNWPLFSMNVGIRDVPYKKPSVCDSEKAPGVWHVDPPTKYVFLASFMKVIRTMNSYLICCVWRSWLLVWYNQFSGLLSWTEHWSPLS